MKVVILGKGAMLINLVKGAQDAGCEISGVLRYERVVLNPFKLFLHDFFKTNPDVTFIKKFKIPEVKVKSANCKKFREFLIKNNTDVLLVGTWREKIKKDVFDVPKIASINAHPSLLPAYRGPNPYFWTIRNGEKVSGVSFHLIDNGFDTGAILAQEEVKIYNSDTGKSLKDRTVLTARGVVCELLNALREDIIIPLTQREDKASYYSHPENLELDFTKSAEENHALIRAAFPWTNAYFYHNNTCIAAHHESLEISENDTEFSQPGTITNVNHRLKRISVLCGDNKILTFNISLYKKYDRPFTPNYIKREMSIGNYIL